MVAVHNMNKKGPGNQDSYKSLLMLDEISKGEPLSQRDLSKKLNIALGLVNSYIKNLVSKGYITINAIPSKRFAYYLTPKGFEGIITLDFHTTKKAVWMKPLNNIRKAFPLVRSIQISTTILASLILVKDSWIKLLTILNMQ